MSLLDFLGLGGRAQAPRSEPASLREIGARLEGLPPEEARFAAAFAYLLARIAGADLRTEDSERLEMVRHLERFGELDADRAKLLGQTAVQAAWTYSASDDHLVARAFRDMSEPEERLRLLRCLYAVAAADQTISTREDNAIFEIATTLDMPREAVVGIRADFREYLGALKALPGER